MPGAHFRAGRRVPPLYAHSASYVNFILRRQIGTASVLARLITDGTNSLPRSALFFLEVRFHRDAGTNQMPVTVDIVDATDGRPELVLTRPRRRKRGLLARVRMIP